MFWLLLIEFQINEDQIKIAEVKKNGQKFIIKKLKLSCEISNDILQKEINHLQNIDHPNLLKYYDIFKTDDNFLCFVNDFTQPGNLSNALDNLEIEEYDEETLKYLIK